MKLRFQINSSNHYTVTVRWILSYFRQNPWLWTCE